MTVGLTNRGRALRLPLHLIRWDVLTANALLIVVVPRLRSSILPCRKPSVHISTMKGGEREESLAFPPSPSVAAPKARGGEGRLSPLLPRRRFAAVSGDFFSIPSGKKGLR
ncbi:hypothetical protein OPV22_005429 [Ensete ventricosum]|uniref:Uncharacterized protein n=1 Tax=Ensete ventricosum TaxID=4639 RepID=A0AAV8RGL3_ENSVE|nr:hypothetical protein OPV22_005429 [Ensete ventricosum]